MTWSWCSLQPAEAAEFLQSCPNDSWHQWEVEELLRVWLRDHFVSSARVCHYSSGLKKKRHSGPLTWHRTVWITSQGQGDTCMNHSLALNVEDRLRLPLLSGRRHHSGTIGASRSWQVVFVLQLLSGANSNRVTPLQRQRGQQKQEGS